MKKNNANNQIFESIWKDWESLNINEQIMLHKSRREPFLGIIDATIKKLDRSPVKILEVGCGSGIDTHIIAQDDKRKVFGVDVSEKAIEIAEKVSLYFERKVTLSVGDANSLSFENSFFDIVFSQGVLEHFENYHSAIEEQLRVLSAGGLLVINVPQKYTVYTIYKHILMWFNKWPWGKETEFSYLKMKKISRIYGLEIIDYGGYDYWLHPLEITWVLRSLCEKIYKINPWKECSPFKTFRKWYDDLWRKIERSKGHLFMKNIVVVLRKSADENITS